MATVAFFDFKGMVPGRSPRLIPEDVGQLVVNFDNGRGTLLPFNDASVVGTLGKSGGIKTLYKLADGIMLHWNDPVSVARLPIENNATNRIAYTGDGTPKQTDEDLADSPPSTIWPAVSYALGLPAPAEAPEVSVSQAAVSGLLQLQWDVAGTVDAAQGGRTARVYTYTFVNQWGQEGPPSDPSHIVYANDQDIVRVEGFELPLVGDYLIEAIRIYRAVTGTVSDTEYLFVAEIPAATTHYDDSLTDTELGESLITETWSPPPDDLAGLTGMANGVLAGFVDNAVYLCEPYQGHAWPEDYVRYVDYPVVALAASGNMLFIATEGYPYVLIGSHPTAMSLVKHDKARAMAAVGNGALYVSAQGIMLVTAGEARLLTADTIDQKFWESLNPASMHCYYHDERYFGFYSGATPTITGVPTTGGFIYDFKGQQLFFIDLGYTVGAAFSDPIDALLYLCDDSISATDYLTWDTDSGAPLSASWRSKQVETSKRNMEAARVSAEGYPVTFRLLADGVLQIEKTVLNNEPFRLPSGYKGRVLEVEIDSEDEIHGVFLADYVGELE